MAVRTRLRRNDAQPHKIRRRSTHANLAEPVGFHRDPPDRYATKGVLTHRMSGYRRPNREGPARRSRRRYRRVRVWRGEARPRSAGRVATALAGSDVGRGRRCWVRRGRAVGGRHRPFAPFAAVGHSAWRNRRTHRRNSYLPQWRRHREQAEEHHNEQMARELDRHTGDTERAREAALWERFGAAAAQLADTSAAMLLGNRRGLTMWIAGFSASAIWPSDCACR